MDQVICFSGVLMAWRAFEKILIVEDDYFVYGARVAVGIVMFLVELVILIAVVDEDVEHCKKAKEKSQKAKESFFDYVDGERVISLHICAVAICSKVCIWSGLDYWRSFLIPALVFGVIFIEICTISGDLQKYNEQKQIRAQRKGHIGVFVGIDANEAKNFEKQYRTFSMTYAKMLGACLVLLRFIFYPYVNDCQDSWSMVNYLILDLLLLFSVIKDYDVIKDQEKYILVAANLVSLCMYMNLKVIAILPFYLGLAYLMKKFGHKIFCFVYVFVLILLNQYLTWIYHQQIMYQLHFVSKMICYTITLSVFLIIYKTDRRFLIFVKLFKPIFAGFMFLLVLVLISELETNSYGTDILSFKIKQEFAFLCLLLCLEIMLFVRLHVYFSQPKAQPQPKKKDQFMGVQSQEEKEKEKLKAQDSQIQILMNKLLQISWKDDPQMKGQLKQISNLLSVICVVLLNLFFFNEKIILICLNYCFLNRWVYIIKGINDAKLFFWHHLMYVFQFLSKYFLKDLFKGFLVDFIGAIFPWKKNLLTNLALNFANIRQNIDGRSSLLQEGDDFELQFHDIKNHHLEIDTEELENEMVIIVILSALFALSMRRGREWKNRLKTLKMVLVPLWVYILLFEEYDYYINCMAVLQVVMIVDEQFFKPQIY